MNPQESLLNFLETIGGTTAARVLFKRSAQEFVLEYGWWYEPTPLPKKFASGVEQECIKNSVNLMLDHDDLFYCEGFAMFSDRSFPVIHAWVTNGTGIAIDNTWPQQGVAYAGVPFKSSFLNTTALTYREIVSLLDDFQNGYPLRNELGDRPDEWLERRGKGIGPIRL